MEKTLEKRHMSFDDLVFEGRNKAYGSYWLRKKYARYLLIAFLISLFGVSAGISVPVIRAYMFEAEEVVLEEIQEVQIDMIQVDDELAPIAPPPPPPSAAEAQVRYTAPAVVDTVMQEVQLATIDEVREIITNEPVPEQIIEVVEEEETVIIEDEPAFVFVEEEATFQGGTLEDFRVWIGQNIVYPPLAIENNVFGRVTVQFAVNSRGEVVDVVVVRGVDKLLDAEAVRVIQSSPRWTAARQGGRPVKQLFTVPVVFTLTE